MHDENAISSVKARLVRDAQERAAVRKNTVRQAGFTLVEVLVAFTILAMATIVIQRAVGVALDNMSRAEARVAAENIARTLLTGPLASGASALLPSRGSMNGYDWSLNFAATALPSAASTASPGEQVRWRAVRMTVNIRDRRFNSQGLSLDTIRLVKIAPQ